MTSISLQAAEALSPTLSVFHAVQGAALKGVRQVLVEGSLEQIIFDFSSALIVVTADEDDDTIDLVAVPHHETTPTRKGVDVTNLEPWTELVDRPFGWGWVIINQQGYVDGVLLSFSGLVPQILLNVIASSIKISRIATVSL